MVCTSKNVGNRVQEDREGQRQPTVQRAAGSKGKRQFHPLGGIPLLRKYLQPLGIDKITLERIVDSTWRPGTVKLYSHYIKKWQLYCHLRDIDPLQPEVAQVLRFLRNLDDDGLGFGAINTARSALSLILPRDNGQTMGKNQVVCWLLKSVYERKPPKPKYDRFWDVKQVFNMLEDWPDNEFLSLKDLGFKVALLILLITGHRGQTVLALNVDKMELSKDEVTFDLQKLLKSNRVGDPLSTVTLKSFREKKKLCVVRAIRMYVNKTKKIRTSNQLLLSFIRPNKPISRDTLARWTVTMLAKAGINTKKYASHSTRGAVASKARTLGVSVKTILQCAGWKTSISFAKHYNKKVETSDTMATRLLRK